MSNKLKEVFNLSPAPAELYKAMIRQAYQLKSCTTCKHCIAVDINFPKCDMGGSAIHTCDSYESNGKEELYL